MIRKDSSRRQSRGNNDLADKVYTSSMTVSLVPEWEQLGVFAWTRSGPAVASILFYDNSNIAKDPRFLRGYPHLYQLL